MFWSSNRNVATHVTLVVFPSKCPNQISRKSCKGWQVCTLTMLTCSSSVIYWLIGASDSTLHDGLMQRIKTNVLLLRRKRETQAYMYIALMMWADIWVYLSILASVVCVKLFSYSFKSDLPPSESAERSDLEFYLIVLTNLLPSPLVASEHPAVGCVCVCLFPG